MPRRRATAAVETTLVGGTAPLRIPRFRPETMIPDTIIMFSGPRRSGKTVTMTNLLQHIRRHLYAAVVQTPTDDTRKSLAPYIPWTCMHDDFDERTLARIMETMRTLCNAERAKAMAENRPPNHRYLLVLLDDCMAEKGSLKVKPIRDIFYNGRHEDITFMNIQQFIMDMPHNLRNSIDYVFATHDDDPKNITRLWDYFFQNAFPREADFRAAFNKCTENYGCMVLDRTVKTGNPMDQVFVFNARIDIPPFRVGHPDIWTLHFRHLKSREEELNKTLDSMQEIVRRKYREADDAAATGAGTELVVSLDG